MLALIQQRLHSFPKYFTNLRKSIMSIDLVKKTCIVINSLFDDNIFFRSIQ